MKLELEESSTSKNYILIQYDGGREGAGETKFYNLDMILAQDIVFALMLEFSFFVAQTKSLKKYMPKDL